MKTVDFGLGTQYDEGTQTAVAINAGKTVLEVHKSQNEDTLWCHVGSLGRATVNWGPSVRYDDGVTPAVALNGGGKAVEVHRSQNDDALWYHVGTVSGGAVAWGKSHKYDQGRSPAVALNDAGVAVEVHKSQNEDTLWCHVGTLSGDEVKWGSSHKYDSGLSPSVALNGRGQVVEVHQSQNEDTLWYRVGTVSGSEVKWGPSRRYDDGVQPAVALTDEGLVVEAHRSQSTTGLWSRSGVVEGDSIRWSGSVQYDTGTSVSVGCSGLWAVQTHQSESASTLWYTAALLVDRARWMSDRRDALAARTLRDIAFPGSHDAGMYEYVSTELSPAAAEKSLESDITGVFEEMGEDIAGAAEDVGEGVTDAAEEVASAFDDALAVGTSLVAWTGKTQDLNLHGQLSHGSRYFDLRPRRSGGGTVYICHGEIQGPPLAEVLDDVKRFMQEENGELVILKFSHFDGFDDQGYAELAEQVTGALRDWLYPGGARLAEVPLGDLLGGKGVVYVVMDTTYYAENRTPGIYVYRDSTKCNVKKGDLRVLDLYSNTTSYPEMEQQQLQLFADFDGICHPDEDPAKACDQGETCDLFLLSWTLTPVSGVWLWAQDADRNLAAGVQKTANPNGHGRRINVVFLDYVQYARPVDVCLCLNGLA